MKRKWYKLDNAALIFPSIIKKGWSNAFRISVTLNETVDPIVLEKAINMMKKRFPTFFVCLRTGFFWFYLVENSKDIKPILDYAYPLTHMSRRDLAKSCIKVLYFENRIAVEFFHSVTDGNGGLIFVKNLTATYLSLKKGISIPLSDGLVDLDSAPLFDEINDAFRVHSAPTVKSRSETNSYMLKGTKEEDHFLHLVTGEIDTTSLLEVAHKYNASVTAFLSAIMIDSIIKIQRSKKKRQKDVKVTIPINLRRLYGEKTLRNFILTLNIGVNPNLGEYSIQELCDIVSNSIKLEATPKLMSERIAANIHPQESKILRVVPLFFKVFAMRLVYNRYGERKGSINISNLGQVNVPKELKECVSRFEFIIGPQLMYPNNMSLCSYNGKTYIEMIRNIKEAELERVFFSKLVEEGLTVLIESNERS